MPPRYNLAQTFGDVSSKLGNALMQVAQTTEARTNRAYDLARQGRLDGMAMQRIQMDHEMLTESRKRTADLLESQRHARGRAASDIIRSQADLGYTPQTDDVEAFASALGTGQVGQWDFDPTQSGAYARQEAVGDLATEQAGERYAAQTPQILERAEIMRAEGMTPTGQPITAPRPVPADPSTYITGGGTRWPRTEEGKADMLEWVEQVSEAQARPPQTPWYMQPGEGFRSQGVTPAGEGPVMEEGIGGVVGAVPGTVISDIGAQDVIDSLGLTGGDASEIAYAILQGANEEDLIQSYRRQQ